MIDTLGTLYKAFLKIIKIGKGNLRTFKTSQVKSANHELYKVVRVFVYLCTFNKIASC